MMIKTVSNMIREGLSGRFRWLWRVAFACVVVIAIAFGAMLWGWWQVNRTPVWWVPPTDVTSAAVVETGEDFENRMLTDSSRVRKKNMTWTLVVTEEEINAWLSTRLPRWMENQQPNQSSMLGSFGDIAQVHVRIKDGRIRFGARIGVVAGDVESGYVVSAMIEPQIGVEGGLMLGLGETAAGRLPVPADSIVSMFEQQLRAAGNDVLKLIVGDEIDPVIQMPNNQRIRVLELEVNTGEIILTCQTMVNGDG